MMIERTPAKIWRNRELLYRLKYARCNSCKRSFYPPRSRCIYCGSTDLEFRYSSGRGVLREYTIVYQTPAGHGDFSPLVIGLIDLDEGFSVIAQVVDVELDKIRPGMRVEAVLRRLVVDGSTGLIYYGLKFAPTVSE
ncbi:MAG: Zn-ribbon domain-containing OB-fold protein [Sulfolobales archaeon]